MTLCEIYNNIDFLIEEEERLNDKIGNLEDEINDFEYSDYRATINDKKAEELSEKISTLLDLQKMEIIIDVFDNVSLDQLEDLRNNVSPFNTKL